MKNPLTPYAFVHYPHARQLVITLRPTSAPTSTGYVWRRVFLKGGRPKE